VSLKIDPHSVAQIGGAVAALVGLVALAGVWWALLISGVAAVALSTVVEYTSRRAGQADVTSPPASQPRG
jgi:uncharacterized membrane protein YjjP (DUF1212 family)